jgi:hypothetical protein
MIHGYAQFFENKIEPHQQDMYDGIVDILKRVRDLKNRTEIAEHMLKDFKKENINVDEMTFMNDCGIIDSKGNYLTT